MASWRIYVDPSISGQVVGGHAGLHRQGQPFAVARIAGMSQQMAAASEQQAHVAEDISQQITRIAQLSDHSAIQAQQGAGISQELEQMAEYLHSLAERFNR